MLKTCESGFPFIIYQQDGIIAVNKPAGLYMYAWPGHPPGLRERLAETTGLEDLHSVHRLDMGTTGVVVFGATSAVRRDLTAQFYNRTVEKTYWAVVEGEPPNQNWVNDYPLEFKLAYTAFSRLECWQDESGKPYSLVEAKPKTGRTHQIRRHLAMDGFPIAGDETYGSSYQDTTVRRPLLHALRLKCRIPKTGSPLLLEARLPEDFASFIANYSPS